MANSEASSVEREGFFEQVSAALSAGLVVWIAPDDPAAAMMSVAEYRAQSGELVECGSLTTSGVSRSARGMAAALRSLCEGYGRGDRDAPPESTATADGRRDSAPPPLA